MTSRRALTIVVLVVVTAIALAAAFDTLRGGPTPAGGQTEAGRPAGSTATGPEAAAEGIGGTLYYTDEGCELRAIEPPGERPVETPEWDECSFVLSPDGRRVSGEGSSWDPHSEPLIGKLFQSEDGTIQVATNRGPEGEPFLGTAPAWRPDGTLTYFANGAVREWPGGEIVLSQRDLVRALRTGGTGEMSTLFDRLLVRESAWLDDRRLAAILSADGPELRMDMLAIYDGTELGPFTFDGAGGFSDLRVSPGGRYTTAKSTGGRDAPGGFVMLEWGRGERITPRIDGYRALAWSPDDRWMAIAANDGVFLFQPNLAWLPGPELDIDAHDVTWRP